ncbi:MAG: hypothetical protein A2V67_02915 [Deltaproteobacteria bacterium RBG_13_61_14]|nr:MAG: hypothetical protein A2V67_02915 [Deltaproteobacteria bacterium RBG_13_61_14]
MIIRAILFDLDDTLYLEKEFFQSGFAVVAAELEARGIGSAGEIQILLERIHLGEGRERVLNKAAARLPFPESWVGELVDRFRAHAPKIQIQPEDYEVLRCLRQQYRLGCITDGFSAVQRRKIQALGIQDFFNALVIADELGRQYWKPHPLPFLTCCQQLQVPPAQAVFVGDHPERDIQGARRAGLTSIRIRREQSYFFYRVSSGPERADFEISRLSELEGILQHLQGKA